MKMAVESWTNERQTVLSRVVFSTEIPSKIKEVKVINKFQYIGNWEGVTRHMAKWGRYIQTFILTVYLVWQLNQCTYRKRQVDLST